MRDSLAGDLPDSRPHEPTPRSTANEIRRAFGRDTLARM
jgi:hypothetical protein